MKDGATLHLYIAMPGQMTKEVAIYPLAFLSDHGPVALSRIPWAGPFDIYAQVRDE